MTGPIPNLTIRAFQSADRLGLEQLWGRVFADDPPWNAPAVMIENKLKVQPELLLVGILDAVLVGAVMAGFDGVRGWIYHLAVAPECRRRGIATQLVRAAEAGLRKLGCPKVNIQVRATNGEVVAFYRSLAYIVEERVSMGRRLEAVQVVQEPARQHDVVSLIEALDSYVAGLYPAESNHLMDIQSLAARDVRLFVARLNGGAVGCGALRVDPSGYGEIKRMYVAPSARGQGIGQAILVRLEEEARAAGLSSVRLETGIRQPEAVGLYRAAGYREIPPFGNYRPDPMSVFMEKAIP
ncbi:MAG TPA: GNAT family acetyltransferase [Polyangia bacterium]|jgi:putative acetyltransferase|nr:GNAT family acetyltransferase [Polyangia bacterium]